MRQEPAGSVYLSLPREPLCEMADAPLVASQSVPTKPYPDPEAIKTLAAEIAEAKNPLIICSRGDREGQVGALITQIAKENSIAVRGSEATTNIQCNAISGLEALKEALPSEANVERANKMHQKHVAFRSKIQDKAEACEGDVLNKPFAAKCVSEVIGDGVIFAELAANQHCIMSKGQIVGLLIRKQVVSDGRFLQRLFSNWATKKGWSPVLWAMALMMRCVFQRLIFTPQERWLKQITCLWCRLLQTLIM